MLNLFTVYSDQNLKKPSVTFNRIYVVLALALLYLLLCTLSVLACYRPLAVNKHLNTGIELNYHHYLRIHYN
jgi:hypothetical protein